jgi:hypothetical protein
MQMKAIALFSGLQRAEDTQFPGDGVGDGRD